MTIGQILLLLLLLLYFVPAFVAIARRHPQVGAIVALNILLGWTMLGWVGALVWALVKPQPTIYVTAPPPAEDMDY